LAVFKDACGLHEKFDAGCITPQQYTHAACEMPTDAGGVLEALGPYRTRARRFGRSLERWGID